MTMAKFPRPSSEELIRFLNTRGYVQAHVRGDHVILKKDARRMLSVPKRKEMGRGVLLAILRQAEIPKLEFLEWKSGKTRGGR